MFQMSQTFNSYDSLPLDATRLHQHPPHPYTMAHQAQPPMSRQLWRIPQPGNGLMLIDGYTNNMYYARHPITAKCQKEDKDFMGTCVLWTVTVLVVVCAMIGIACLIMSKCTYIILYPICCKLNYNK